MIDERLLKFAVPSQKKILEMVIRLGSFRAAAKELNLHHDKPRMVLRTVTRKAAKQGYAPEQGLNHPVPEGFGVRRISTNYKGDGSVGQKWVIAEVDKREQLEFMLKRIEQAGKEVTPILPIMGPSFCRPDLLNLYVITDYHLGMRAWAEETGASWNLEIAKQMLFSAFKHLVDVSPPATIGFLAQLGDLLHTDALLPLTPKSKHVLDQDASYGQMVDAAVDVLEQIVAYALTKHEKVVVLMAEGNHDESSSVWLRVLFKALFRDNPRVEVITDQQPYYAYEFGVNMLSFHHGHMAKKASLPLLMASKFSEMWGRTKKRVCHTGHEHHLDEKEHSGMTVHQHRTLAAPDAYTTRHGYMSEREACAITYSAKLGMRARNYVSPEMLAA